MPVVGDVMGFCSWLFVEGFEEKRGVGEEYMTNNKCLLCGSEIKEYPIMGDTNCICVDCSNCGEYNITRNADWWLKKAIGKALHDDEFFYGSEEKQEEFNKQLFILSSYISLYNEKEDAVKRILTVDFDFIKMVLTSSFIPRTPEEKIESILKYIHKKTAFYGEFFYVSCNVIYSDNKKELGNLIKELVDNGYLKQKKDGLPYQKTSEDDFIYYTIIPLSITLKGISFLREKSSIQERDKCFIAMWFDPKMDKVWDEVIKPACEETGYKPIRIDKEQFNDDINDHIISEIRESFFVIADLTGFRGGVYYEAGFARGLGKEVILCCKDGYEVNIKYYGSGEEKTEKGPHFDVNHINIIFWNDDLLAFKKRLKDRILATVERGSYIFPKREK